MCLSNGDNISNVKIGRISQPCIDMLRILKEFFGVTFKIEECQDDVYDEESENEEEEKNNDEEEDKEKEKNEEMIDDKENTFPQTFIFSCIGIGLKNMARKTE